MTHKHSNEPEGFLVSEGPRKSRESAKIKNLVAPSVATQNPGLTPSIQDLYENENSASKSLDDGANLIDHHGDKEPLKSEPD